MSRHHRLWTVVLAAGGSRRLGRPKQLLKHGGRTLLVRAVERAERMTPGRVVVVLGAHAPRLRVVLDRAGFGGVRIVRNPRWRSGMASSLRSGLSVLPQEAAAALIVLTDQPGIAENSLARLAAAWQEDPATAVAAGCAGRVGVPAILPKTWWREVMNLRGDEGARRLLAAADALHLIDMPEAATDIDTAADAAGLAARQATGGHAPQLPVRRRLRRRRSRS